MSLNFENPLDIEQQKIVEELLGDSLAAKDDRTMLFKEMVIKQKEISRLANELKQPVVVEINGIGDEKTMTDGTKYRCTNKGWIKV